MNIYLGTNMIPLNDAIEEGIEGSGYICRTADKPRYVLLIPSGHALDGSQY
jgi:hypothetical protein